VKCLAGAVVWFSFGGGCVCGVRQGSALVVCWEIVWEISN
jgi:hypothetical protein